VLQVCLECQVLLVLVVPLVVPDLWVHQVYLVRRELQEVPEQLVCQVDLVQLDQADLRDLPAILVLLDL